MIFRLPEGAENREIVRFREEFYGREKPSGGGKYSFHHEGLLERIPHRRLIRGVVILRERDLEEVERFLRGWRARIETRVIRATPKDERALDRSST